MYPKTGSLAIPHNQLVQTFFALLDSVLSRFPKSCKGHRHATVMSALVYRAKRFGIRFKQQLADIERSIRSSYCRRSIITTLQELAALGHIVYVSDGRGLWITLAPQYLEKCKISAHLINKEEKKKPYTRFQAYRPTDYGPVAHWNGCSLEEYNKAHPDQALTLDEWLAQRVSPG